MKKKGIKLIFLLYSLIISELNMVQAGIILPSDAEIKDSLERQILYNGRIWKYQFYNADGHQFFLSPDFLTGSIGVDGYTFDSVKIKYDVFNDELLIKRNDGTIIQLNKEMINSFSLYYIDKIFCFSNFNNYPVGNMTGYWNVLYDTGIKIYVKYLKEILPTTITNGPPRFNQVNKISIIKDGQIHRTNNRKELLNLFVKGEEQSMIKKYIRNNQIKISRNEPDSFRRVIEYFETKNK